MEAFLKNVPATPYAPRVLKAEPAAPVMVSPIPGPKSKALSEKMAKYQDSRHVIAFQDVDKSVGNYVRCTQPASSIFSQTLKRS